MVSSATTMLRHVGGTAARVASSELKKHGTRPASSDIRMNSVTDAARVSTGPSGSARARATPERRWWATIPPEVRAYAMPSHVVIHERVPPPDARSISFAASASGVGLRPIRDRRRARKAPRTIRR